VLAWKNKGKSVGNTRKKAKKEKNIPEYLKFPLAFFLRVC
jgi:hypothetical protein